MRLPLFAQYFPLLFALGELFCTGCEDGRLERHESKVEVEIAPDKWLTVEKTDWYYPDDVIIADRPLPEKERTRLRMTWGGQNVTWESVAIPITLREWEGKLYIIGYDRETDPDKPRFRYYRQKGNSFEEIKPHEFPKRIATQNMWIVHAKMPDDDPEKYMDLHLTRKLDPDKPYFDSTMTGHIWAQLATGKDDTLQYAGVEDVDILKDFKEKYDPIPLPTIVKLESDRTPQDEKPH